jgi:hypothetical protein
LDYLKNHLTAEECDGLEMMALSKTWLPEEQASMVAFLRYARLAWNLEVAALAAQCQEGTNG